MISKTAAGRKTNPENPTQKQSGWTRGTTQGERGVERGEEQSTPRATENAPLPGEAHELDIIGTGSRPRQAQVAKRNIDLNSFTIKSSITTVLFVIVNLVILAMPNLTPEQKSQRMTYANQFFGVIITFWALGHGLQALWDMSHRKN